VTGFDELPEELRAELAHELRTPLAAILGYAELLESRSDERTRLEAARTIREAAERISATVERAFGPTTG
jgi:signal transduction histidine kinase